MRFVISAEKVFALKYSIFDEICSSFKHWKGETMAMVNRGVAFSDSFVRII